jgi:exodeoxyribonuclease VII large subunit
VLTSVERRLPDPHKLIAAARDAIQGHSLRLQLAAPRLIATQRTDLGMASQRLAGAVHRTLTVLRSATDRVAGRISDAPLRASLREARAHLAGVGSRLAAASPTALLQRGYVLVTAPGGHPVTSAASVKPGGRLRLHFGDGDVDVVAQGAPSRGRPAEAQEKLPL